MSFHDKPFVFANPPERGVTYWDWTLVPVKDSEGKVTGLVLSLIETTDRVRAREKLQTYERLAMLGQVAGSISHELRNPLASIANSVFFLKKKLPDTDENIQANLDRIKSNVDQSTHIIQSLLDMTRIKERPRVKVSLGRIIDLALQQTRLPPMIQMNRVLKEDHIIVEGDEKLLTMAFQNIFTNAVEAMGTGGTLTINIEKKDGQAEVSVCDTGVGVAPENINRVFEPLFTTKKGGFGLGLAVVKVAIENHGGTIKYVSESGKGTTVVIRLPVSDQQSEES